MLRTVVGVGLALGHRGLHAIVLKRRRHDVELAAHRAGVLALEDGDDGALALADLLVRAVSEVVVGAFDELGVVLVYYLDDRIRRSDLATGVRLVGDRLNRGALVALLAHGEVGSAGRRGVVVVALDGGLHGVVAGLRGLRVAVVVRTLGRVLVGHVLGGHVNRVAAHLHGDARLGRVLVGPVVTHRNRYVNVLRRGLIDGVRNRLVAARVLRVVGIGPFGVIGVGEFGRRRAVAGVGGLAVLDGIVVGGLHGLLFGAVVREVLRLRIGDLLLGDGVRNRDAAVLVERGALGELICDVCGPLVAVLGPGGRGVGACVRGLSALDGVASACGHALLLGAVVDKVLRGGGHVGLLGRRLLLRDVVRVDGVLERLLGRGDLRGRLVWVVVDLLRGGDGVVERLLVLGRHVFGAYGQVRAVLGDGHLGAGRVGVGLLGAGLVNLLLERGLVRGVLDDLERAGDGALVVALERGDYGGSAHVHVVEHGEVVVLALGKRRVAVGVGELDGLGHLRLAGVGELRRVDCHRHLRAVLLVDGEVRLGRAGVVALAGDGRLGDADVGVVGVGDVVVRLRAERLGVLAGAVLHGDGGRDLAAGVRLRVDGINRDRGDVLRRDGPRNRLVGLLVVALDVPLVVLLVGLVELRRGGVFTGVGLLDVAGERVRRAEQRLYAVLLLAVVDEAFLGRRHVDLGLCDGVDKVARVGGAVAPGVVVVRLHRNLVGAGVGRLRLVLGVARNLEALGDLDARLLGAVVGEALGGLGLLALGGLLRRDGPIDRLVGLPVVALDVPLVVLLVGLVKLRRGGVALRVGAGVAGERVRGAEQRLHALLLLAVVDEALLGRRHVDLGLGDGPGDGARRGGLIARHSLPSVVVRVVERRGGIVVAGVGLRDVAGERVRGAEQRLHALLLLAVVDEALLGRRHVDLGLGDGPTHGLGRGGRLALGALPHVAGGQGERGAVVTRVGGRGVARHGERHGVVVGDARLLGAVVHEPLDGRRDLGLLGLGRLLRVVVVLDGVLERLLGRGDLRGRLVRVVVDLLRGGDGVVERLLVLGRHVLGAYGQVGAVLGDGHLGAARVLLGLLGAGLVDGVLERGLVRGVLNDLELRELHAGVVALALQHHHGVADLGVVEVEHGLVVAAELEQRGVDLRDGKRVLHHEVIRAERDGAAGVGLRGDGVGRGQLLGVDGERAGLELHIVVVVHGAVGEKQRVDRVASDVLALVRAGGTVVEDVVVHGAGD